MGMTVFSGMLIATIIGVCLVPVLFVAVEKVLAWRSGGAKEQSAPGPGVGPTPSLRPGTAIEMTADRHHRGRAALALILPLLLSSCMLGPGLPAPGST